MKKKNEHLTIVDLGDMNSTGWIVCSEAVKMEKTENQKIYLGFKL
jgi:hypothetical protein